MNDMRQKTENMTVLEIILKQLRNFWPSEGKQFCAGIALVYGLSK